MRSTTTKCDIAATRHDAQEVGSATSKAGNGYHRAHSLKRFVFFRFQYITLVTTGTSSPVDVTQEHDDNPRQADNPPLQAQGGARERVTTLNVTQKPRGQDHNIKRGMGTMGLFPEKVHFISIILHLLKKIPLLVLLCGRSSGPVETRVVDIVLISEIKDYFNL